ncbi:MAG: glycosyltransferase, partial [Lachnoclostridium sp.]|nr:glycosyltransferase [Lachnoclostridium sp.]
YTRKDFGLPEDKVIAVVVGGRLAEEVTESFVTMLESIFAYHIYVVFAGDFSGKYEEYAKENVGFAKNTKYVGFVEDMLAFFECCDLFLNPERAGGGGAALESLFKGIPVITTRFGDSAVNVGEDFCVQDYEEMSKMAIRYIEDQEFYRRQAVKGKERAALLLDSGRAFRAIIGEAEKRAAFHERTE